MSSSITRLKTPEVVTEPHYPPVKNCDEARLYNASLSAHALDRKVAINKGVCS
jgi:hypothetical protein